MNGGGQRTVCRWLLAAALLAGFVARAPGIYWGHNFPSESGFAVHHPDEWTHLVIAEEIITHLQRALLDKGLTPQSMSRGNRLEDLFMRVTKSPKGE